MRRTLLGLLGALLTVSLAAPTAHADTAKITPTITLTSPDTTLYFDHQTTTVTGTVTAKSPDGTTGPLADQAVQIYCNGGCTSGTVTTDQAGTFSLPMRHGSVTASIVATDSIAYTYDFLLINRAYPRITAKANPTIIKPSSPKANISGKLEYLSVDGTYKPLPGRKIHGESAGEATTGADGSFTIVIPVEIRVYPELVPLLWDAEGSDKEFFSGGFGTAFIRFGAAPTISALSGSMNATGIVTISGHLGGRTANVPVRIQSSPDGKSGWKDVATVTTWDAFSATFATSGYTAYYRAEIIETEEYDGAVSPVLKIAPSVASVSGFTASVNANHIVTVRGSVGPKNLKVPAVIQYSSDGKTGWHTAKSLKPTTGPFSTTFKTPLNTGYYRAQIESRYAYKGSTSRVVKAGRTPTRIAGVKVSTTRAKKNTYFTIKGTLQRHVSGWTGLKGQRVRIVFHLKGSKALHLYSTPLTGTGGKFTAKIKATRDAYWTTTYLGATGYYAYSSPKYLHVSLR